MARERLITYTYNPATSKFSSNPVRCNINVGYSSILIQFQFCFIFVHSIYVITTNCSSIYPPWMPAVALFYMITLLLLFSKFYLGAYLSPKKKPHDGKQENRRLYKKDENQNKKMS